MADEVVIKIGAQDNASAAFKSLADLLDRLGKKTEETSKKTKDFSAALKSVSVGSTQLYSGVMQMSSGLTGMVAGVTSATAGLRNLAIGFKAAGVAASVATAAMAAIVVTVAALSKLKGIVTDTAELGDELHALSQKTGIAVESLSTLAYAAEQSNTDLSSVATGLKFLARNAFEAADGTGEQAEAFRQLRVNVKDAHGAMRPVDSLFLEIADRVRALSSDTERTAIMLRIFGRSATDLVPMFLEGSDAIAAMQERARELGLEMSAAEAEAADTFGDALHELGAVLAGVGQSIGIVLIPPLTTAIKAFIALAEAIFHPIKTVKQLVPVLEYMVKIIATTHLRIKAATDAAFRTMWNNIPVMWQLYVIRPLLASWQYLLEQFAGILGYFGVDVESQLTGVRSKLRDLEDLELDSPVLALSRAVSAIPWPEFESGIEAAGRAVDDF